MSDVPPSLSTMFIQSTDTLRETQVEASIPPTWNDKPPLLEGPRGQPETPNLLKGMIRKGIPPALRCAVWLSNVIQSVHPHQDSNYWHDYRTLAKVRALDGAYDMMMNVDYNQMALSTYGQTEDAPTIEGTTEAGQLAVKRVLLALEQVLGMEYAPLVPTLAKLLLTAMSESYVFAAIREMAHESSWYFSISRREYKSTCRAFADVMQKLHHQTHEYLDDRGVFENLDCIFQDFFLNLLPLKYVLRILDIYTLEGTKVLFRFGVTLFVLYKKEASEQLITISNADEWWHTLKYWTHHPDFNFEMVVRKAYGVHGRVLRRQMRFPSRAILRRIIRIEEANLEMDDDDYAEAPPRPLGLVEPTQHANSDEIHKPFLVQSTESRTHLASWLPITLRMTKLELLYSTSYHGRTLEMFYNRVKHAKHTLVLCEVLQKENEPTTVIGMYASQAWRVSSQVYGDGECFLLRLQPDAQCWKWRPHAQTADAVDLDEGSNHTALLEQFMVGTRSYISIGGNPDGSCGLRINEDLTVGESSPAVGFDNEPLHGKDRGSVFQIGLVEVYGMVRQIDGRAV